MKKIKITGPVGKFYKIVDTYVKPPADLVVNDKDRLEEMERSMKSQGIEYNIEDIEEKVAETATATDNVPTRPDAESETSDEKSAQEVTQTAEDQIEFKDMTEAKTTKRGRKPKKK